MISLKGKCAALKANSYSMKLRKRLDLARDADEVAGAVPGLIAAKVGGEIGN